MQLFFYDAWEMACELTNDRLLIIVLSRKSVASVGIGSSVLNGALKKLAWLLVMDCSSSSLDEGSSLFIKWYN